MPTVNFAAPTDYTAEQSAIERQRRLAESLMAQGQTPLGPTETVGGWAIKKSPFEGLAKALQGYSGMKGQEAADTRQKALGEKYQSDLSSTLTRAMSAGSGTPALLANEMDTTGTPAAAPDRSRMAAILMGHPATQQMGMTQMGNDMSRQALVAALSGGGGASGAGGGQSAIGGPAGGVPMAAWIQADPTGKLYMEQLAKDHMEGAKPVINRGFGVGTMVNGKYVPDQASQDQALALERGKQQIKLPYENPVSMPTSSGQNISVFPTEFPTIQAGKLPQRLGGPAPMQSGQAPNDAAAVQAIQQQGGAGPQGNIGGAPMSLEVPSAGAQPAGLGTIGATQPQADVIRQARETAGGKEADQVFAKDYVTFTTGGASDAAKQIAQLGDVTKQLAEGKRLTGPLIGSTPDTLLKFNETGRNAIAMRERVEEVVQRSLRAILGAQFTEKEGERLIARAYNPNLSEKENAIRVGRLQTQLQQALAAKQDAAAYFQKNNTLQGWQGKMPSMSDFDPEKQALEAKIGAPDAIPDGVRALIDQYAPKR